PAFATYPGADGVVRYEEGLRLGYRGLDATGVEPVFCFGHGLTYGSLDWGEATLSTTSASIDGLADDPVTLRLTLHNPGDRTLREVVQVYVSDVECSLERPPQELRGFVTVEVPPGGSLDALVDLGPRAFAYWDPAVGDWVVEPGAFRVSASRSSRNHHAWLSLDLH
ncbi:MAG: fibronectin type III-like domain-contianing protein, partial [Acidobacteria bacterium]|nr:fibronectin type III-like domain-contianing protein [Acidobacteriota bacterium]